MRGIVHTALRVHLNQKGSHCNLAGRNRQVEEKDRDPCE